jgi:4-hydroxy-3-methylbut-2-enyl diphosphate reductase
MRTIVVAKPAGACYGVERALELVRAASEKDESGLVTLGPLIHNPQVVAQLRGRGVREVDDVDDIDAGTVVIRSHGVVPSVIERAVVKGLDIVDATCPHVSKAHKAAAQLREDGFFIVVVGEAGHPEVEGICSYAGENCIVADSPDKLPSLLPSRKVGVVVQTTQTMEALQGVVDALLPRAGILRVHNTICQATQQRQRAAAELAARVDAMVIVGGRNSGNTTRLYQICRSACENSHHIEVADEIDPRWFGDDDLIGVTAGASTPADQIELVLARLESL